MSEKTNIERARSVRGSFRREYEAEDRGIAVAVVGSASGGEYSLRASVPAGIRVNLPASYRGLKVEVVNL
jgi:hypothetical protein